MKMTVNEKEKRIVELEKKIAQCQIIIDGETSPLWGAIKAILTEKRDMLYKQFCRLGDGDDYRAVNFTSDREFALYKGIQQGINQLESLNMMPKTMALSLEKLQNELKRIENIMPQDNTERGQNPDNK